MVARTMSINFFSLVSSAGTLTPAVIMWGKRVGSSLLVKKLGEDDYLWRPRKFDFFLAACYPSQTVEQGFSRHLSELKQKTPEWDCK